MRIVTLKCWRILLAVAVCYVIMLYILATRPPEPTNHGLLWGRAEQDSSFVMAKIPTVTNHGLLRGRAEEVPSCVTAEIIHLQFPICPYPSSEDVWVSSAFRAGRYWESDIVTKMLSLQIGRASCRERVSVPV